MLYSEMGNSKTMERPGKVVFYLFRRKNVFAAQPPISIEEGKTLHDLIIPIIALSVR